MVRKVFDYIVSDPVYGESEDSGTMPLIISMLSLALIFGILIKIVFDRYSTTLYYVTCLISGYAVGKIYAYAQDDEIHLVISSIIPRWVLKVLIPFFMFSTAYRLEHVKYMGIHQIVIIIGAGSAFFLVAFGTLFFVIYGIFELCFPTTMKSMLILSFAIMLFHPEIAVAKLENKGGNVDYLQALIKAEYLWIVFMAFTVGDVIMKSELPDYSRIGIFLLGVIQFSGAFVGLLYGLLVQIYYKYSYGDAMLSSLISFPMSILIYSSAELMQTSGCAATAFYCIYITVVQPPKMVAAHEKFSKELWFIIYFFATTYLTSMLGFILGAVKKETDIRMICIGFGMFVTTIMVRFFYCFLFLPYLYGNKPRWAEIALVVIGPYRGVCSILIALRYAVDDYDEGYQLLILVFLISQLSIFFNVISFDWFLKRLNVFSLSKPQISNMTAAVAQINKCRGNMIFSEKLDRIVADANWPVVYHITSFSHPYKDRIKSSQFGEALKEDVKTVECPRCGAWSIAPPTRKELDEITRETKLRVIKAQQVSYIKQRESGTLTDSGYKFLSSLVYQASFTNDISVNIDDLRINAENLKFVKKCEVFFEKIYNLTSEKYEWKPTNHIRLKCYNIVTSQSFRIAMAVLSLVDMFLCLSVVYCYTVMQHEYKGTNNWPIYVWVMGWFVAVLSPIFYAINLIEGSLQLLGLGIMQYFSKKVYIIEFFSCVIMRTVQGTLFFQEVLNFGTLPNVLDASSVVVYMNCLMFMRVTRFYIFFVAVVPYILVRIKHTIDEDYLKRYDIGKAYLVGLDRVLKYLNQLTTNEQVLEEIKKEVEANRQKVTKELGVIQKERPTIAITVKTKHAIKHVINSMSDCALGLQTEGILDAIEYSAFERSIQIVRSRLNLLKVIVPPSPINIMKEITWLVGDDENTEMFLNEAQMVNYDYNDVLIRNGDDPVGLYILMSGLLKAQYVPSPTSTQLAAKFGVLPNYDFFENFKFDQPQEDYIVSGNVVGEYGVVTGRRYDMTVLAETAVQVYYVPWSVFKDLHETSSGQQLLAKIWKKIAVKISITLLQFTANYRHWSTERLLLFLNRGVMLNLTGIVAVNIDQKVDEAIIVEGVAMDLNNQRIIFGPYRIPKTTTKILLPEHKAWDFQTVYETKLFVVTIPGSSAEELLEAREEEQHTDPDNEDDSITKGLKKKIDKSRKVGFLQETDE